MRKSKIIGEHAIVIGGGIGGLVGARILADHFRKVTIIDRDQLQSNGYRKGVPQANHVHVLLRRGVELLEEAFPGIAKEMESEGIMPLDFARDLCWCQYGGWLPREASDVMTYPQTRPSLEAFTRKRVLALGNVTIVDSTTVRSLLTTADRRRVTGVQVVSKQDPETTTDILADLVLDAGGRGSSIVKWLTTMGYDPPEETRLPIDLCYVTRTYEPTKEARDWRGLWVSPYAPTVPRGGALHTVEGNRWLVSLCGYHGNHPPLDEEGFLAFAKTLYHPALYNILKDAKPLSDSHIFRVPEERWRHFERMAEFPAGLLVIGDAYCVFDPIFGQGMSMAMVEADLLKGHLNKVESAAGLTEAWGKAYFQLCLPRLRGIWYFVSAEALRYPELKGERSWIVRFFQWYVVELYRVNQRFPKAYLEFIKLMHMTSGPEILLHPSIILRMAQRALERLVFGEKAQDAAPLGDVPRRDGAAGRSEALGKALVDANAPIAQADRKSEHYVE